MKLVFRRQQQHCKWTVYVCFSCLCFSRGLHWFYYTTYFIHTLPFLCSLLQQLLVNVIPASSRMKTLFPLAIGKTKPVTHSDKETQFGPSTERCRMTKTTKQKGLLLLKFCKIQRTYKRRNKLFIEHKREVHRDSNT